MSNPHEGYSKKREPNSEWTPELLALRSIVEGTARTTGMDFFHSLVQHLARMTGVRYAFVAEFVERPLIVRTVAFWEQDHIGENFDFALTNHPCFDVYQRGLCHYPDQVRKHYPLDDGLVEWNVHSYLGVPLLDAAGEPLGHLAAFHDEPMPQEPRLLFIFQIFAQRAAVELERLRAEKELQASEERYRDLYENAPHAYVVFDEQMRFLRVNQRTTELLGLPVSALLQSRLEQFLKPEPQNVKRWQASVRDCSQGKRVTGVELELIHVDRSSRWVQLDIKSWENESAKITAYRSIWIDVTAKVMAEREKARLLQQNNYLQEELRSLHPFEEIVGQSSSLQRVLETVQKVAVTETTVLITGETGTGKELIARAIHSYSRRASKPLIKLNCAALPHSLVECELFGHEKGAFTGALNRRAGRFELADGGTIFLDEVGEIPLETQAKLLRVLQEKEFERLGGTTTLTVDVRVLAATNRDLLKMVREGKFREDLYYRLSVFPIDLPPLRKRKEDLAHLVPFFLHNFASRSGKPTPELSDLSQQKLLAYHWPGNIRELQNVLERAVILAQSTIVDLDVIPDLPPLDSTEAEDDSPPAGSSSNRSGTTPSGTTLEDVEKNHVLSVLRQTNWVIEGNRGAAKILGLHPNTLRSRLKKWGVSRTTHETTEE